MSDKERILIVDDDVSTRRTLTLIFEKKEFEVETAGTGREALEKVQERPFNLALLDIRLPDVEGVELLAPLKDAQPDIALIMVTGYASVKTAVRALNDGAAGYITKPVDLDEVLAKVSYALEKQRLVTENRRLMHMLQRELAERVRAEEAREKLIAELEDALSQVRQLQGFLPICSYCKKIRNDENYWQQVETYIEGHSEALFTHSICPDCYEKYARPELEELQRLKNNKKKD
jgi:DNA-binding NtrC family response regulator